MHVRTSVRLVTRWCVTLYASWCLSVRYLRGAEPNTTDLLPPEHIVCSGCDVLKYRFPVAISQSFIFELELRLGNLRTYMSDCAKYLHCLYSVLQGLEQRNKMQMIPDILDTAATPKTKTHVAQTTQNGSVHDAHDQPPSFFCHA